jgi:hypothetical protein
MARPLKDVKGLVFGRLTAVKRVGGLTSKTTGFTRSLWYCECLCGGFKVTTISSLTTGKTKSCGCLKVEASELRCLPYEALYNVLKLNASYRHLEVMTFRQFLKFVNGKKCHYCFAEVVFNRRCRGRLPRKYNLDRKDNSVGYTSKNCVTCCTKCNMGKGCTFSYKEWRRMTKCFRKDHKRVR